MKRVNYFLATIAILAISVFTLCSCNSGNDQPEPTNPAEKFEKKHDTAVLLVTFGSTYDLPKETYEKQVDFFKKAFPNSDHFISYTSRTIINRMQARGEIFLPPALWLQSFLKKEYKNVYVQSLHVIPGEEFTLLRDAYVKKEYNTQLIDLNIPRNPAVLGDPLLASEESIERVAKILVDDHAEHLKAGDAVAFMGHGNPEESYKYANQKYYDVQHAMQIYAKEKYGNPHVYVATVDFDEMLFPYLQAELNKDFEKPGRIHLQPLMSIAGDHAFNDMAGEDTEEDGVKIPLEEQSWKLQLEAMGWKVEAHMKGLGDYDGINQIYLDHLKSAIAEGN